MQLPRRTTIPFLRHHGNGLYSLLLFICLSTIVCTGAPRYNRGSDSADHYTPQRLERRIRCKHSEEDNSAASGHAGKTAEIRKKGKASFYGPGFHGKKTASGEVFNQNDMTAAHRTLPFGTMVRVINTANNRSVVVRINDRGPRKRNRIIDVSSAAAQQLDMIKKGIVPVTIEIVSSP